MLFQDLKIAKSDTFDNYLNKDITWFISTAEKLDNLVKYMQEEIRSCLYNRYPSDKKIRNTVCAYGFS